MEIDSLPEPASRGRSANGANAHWLHFTSSEVAA